MARKSTTPKTRVHIWMDTEIVEKLHLYFDGTVGFSGAINNIVKIQIRQLENRALANAQPITPTSGDLTNDG